MAKSIQPISKASPVSTLEVETPPGVSRERLVAQVAISPTLPSASVIAQYSIPMLGETSVTEVVKVLKDNARQVNDGDLTQVETILSSQAAALNTMFAMLAGRAGENMGKYTATAETYLKLALRAQNQCRATLETLAAIKNPPVVFAKQANITSGPQQVNNTVSASIARTEKTTEPPTELLEHEHGEQWMDIRATATASGRDQAVETMEAVHRPVQRGGKGHGQP